MSWPSDTSEPIMTAAHALRVERDVRGMSAAEQALPPVLIGTFQEAAYAHLLRRVGIATEVEVPGWSLDTLATKPISATGVLGGAPVRVEQFQVGAPVLATSVELAIARGVRDVLVVGSAGSLRADLPLGSTVVVDGVDAGGRQDGTSHHYVPAGRPVLADPELAAELETAAIKRGCEPRRGHSWTTDAPLRARAGGLRRQVEAGALVIEMEAAALFAVAEVCGARAGLIVAVSDTLSDGWRLGFHERAYLAALTRAADAAADVAEALVRR